MISAFRFGIVSDLHIALPHTTWDHPSRFHLVEVSIPALNQVLDHLEHAELDFLLLPGDLTQHGEPDNHAWLVERLAQLPFPVFVVPGNHDGPHLQADERSIGLIDFPYYYQSFGYQHRDHPDHLYYTCTPLPGVRLIALNSNQFDETGTLYGGIDEQQWAWLDQILARSTNELILVMIHHNVVEHLRGQARHPWGQRYVIRNASALIRRLEATSAQLVFTGHFHLQNIARRRGVYEVTTGSLVSYPHPYRIVDVEPNRAGDHQLRIQSHWVKTLPDWPDLIHMSREWMADRSVPVLQKFLCAPPVNLDPDHAGHLSETLRYLWADIAAGDAHFRFPGFPPTVQSYLEKLNRSASCNPNDPVTSDNTTILPLAHSIESRVLLRA